MGKEIFSILRERDDITLLTTEDICGFDKATASESVCIDFTTPEAFRNNYRYIADSFRAAVIGTTGWSDIKQEVTRYFRERGTTMIYASNFSLGVNIFVEIARISSVLLASTGKYDPYITEFHHKFKLAYSWFAGLFAVLFLFFDQFLDKKARDFPCLTPYPFKYFRIFAFLPVYFSINVGKYCPAQNRIRCIYIF